MIGFNYFENQRSNAKSDFIKKVTEDLVQIVNYFSYEVADLKTLLFDLDSGVRGLGGCKQSFKVEDLPSIKKSKEEKDKLLLQGRENESNEEKLARHKAFFEELKKTFNNK